MKKLMILGAGVYQVPLIKTAKKMGLYTIVVSIPGKYPGFAYADKNVYEDTKDFEKVLEVAKRENIDGIVTAGTDVAVVTIGKACDNLGLKGLSYEASQIATDKNLMKKQYEKHGVRSAKYRQISLTSSDIFSELEELDYPLIFKAVDSSGSRGIVKIENSSEINEAVEIVKNVTKRDYFIVEEFLTGEEFGAQAFVLDGKIEFILPHGDYVFQGATGVPIGHWLPYEISDSTLKDTYRQLQKSIEAMKLNNCAINADFMLCEDGVYVLEVGGRSGATCLAEMVSIYYNYNYYEKIIQVSLGESPQMTSENSIPSAAMLLSSDVSGVIKNQGIKEKDDRIIELQFDYKIGDKVNAFHVGTDRIGHVIVSGETCEIAKKNLKDILEMIKFDIE